METGYIITGSKDSQTVYLTIEDSIGPFKQGRKLSSNVTVQAIYHPAYATTPVYDTEKEACVELQDLCTNQDFMKQITNKSIVQLQVVKVTKTEYYNTFKASGFQINLKPTKFRRYLTVMQYHVDGWHIENELSHFNNIRKVKSIGDFFGSKFKDFDGMEKAVEYAKELAEGNPLSTSVVALEFLPVLEFDVYSGIKPARWTSLVTR